MHKWIRRLAALLAIPMLLTGCRANIENTFRLLAMPLRISVCNTATEEERDGLRLLVDRLIAYSPTALDITLVYEEDPVASLLAGEADLIYAPNSVLSGYDANYHIYDSPFYFRDYDHMTMTLNSPNFLEITQEDCARVFGARQLAATYGGTMVLFSKEGAIRTVADLGEQILGVGEDDLTARVFEEMAEEVVRLPILDYTSLDIERLTAIEVNTRNLESLADTETVDLEHAYYAPTNHRIQVQWLLVSNDFYEKLDDTGRAALHEAAAYCVADIDAALQRRHNEGLELLHDLGVRTARVAGESLRKTGRELLLGKTDFLQTVDRARYDEVSQLIR